MVANFKFDSGIKSVLIDGYRSITMTSNGVFSVGKSSNWNSFNDDTGVFTTSNLTIGTLGGLLKATGGVVSVAGSGTDYEPPVTKGNLTSSTASVISIGNGSGAVIGTGTSITINKASAASDGYLGKDDWATFNAKQAALTFYDLSETASGILTITGGTDSVLTNNVTIQVKKASAAQDGYLGKDDWATFNGKLTSPMTANGDLITQIGGVADNLAIGSDTQVLTVVSGLPSWQAPAVGSQILQGNTKAYVKDTGTDGYFAVVTEGSERLRVTSDGYVGIGLINPTQRLYLQDASGFGALVLGAHEGGTHVAGTIEWTGTQFRWFDGTNWKNVGIELTDPLIYKGVIDCSGNPNYPAAEAGHTYRISVAGKIGGASGAVVEVGDMIICNTDTVSGDQATVGGYWDILQVNLNGAVIGPASATDNAIARFDSTTGKLIQDGLATVDDAGSINIPSGQTYKINNVSLAAADVGAEPTLTKGNLTSSTTSVITVGSGSGAVIGTGTSITINKASAASDGYLGKDDWATFNAKQAALTLYDLSETSSGILTISGGTDSVLTNNVTIQVLKASASQDGYLGKNDWSTFNGKLTSPMTANGDLITQIGGVADNLAIGSDTQVLTVVSGLPSWQAPAVGSQILQGNTRAYVKDTGADGYFAVDTEGTEKFRVTPTGTVGIGVVVPTSALDVAGSVEVTSTEWYYIGDPTTDGSWRMGIDTGDFVVQKRVTGSWVTKGNFS